MEHQRASSSPEDQLNLAGFDDHIAQAIIEYNRQKGMGRCFVALMHRSLTKVAGLNGHVVGEYSVFVRGLLSLKEGERQSPEALLRQLLTAPVKTEDSSWRVCHAVIRVLAQSSHWPEYMEKGLITLFSIHKKGRFNGLFSATLMNGVLNANELHVSLCSKNRPDLWALQLVFLFQEGYLTHQFVRAFERATVTIKRDINKLIFYLSFLGIHCPEAVMLRLMQNVEALKALVLFLSKETSCLHSSEVLFLVDARQKLWDASIKNQLIYFKKFFVSSASEEQHPLIYRTQDNLFSVSPGQNFPGIVMVALNTYQDQKGTIRKSLDLLGGREGAMGTSSSAVSQLYHLQNKTEGKALLKCFFDFPGKETCDDETYKVFQVVCRYVASQCRQNAQHSSDRKADEAWEGRLERALDLLYRYRYTEYGIEKTVTQSEVGFERIFHTVFCSPCPEQVVCAIIFLKRFKCLTSAVYDLFFSLDDQQEDVLTLLQLSHYFNFHVNPTELVAIASKGEVLKCVVDSLKRWMHYCLSEQSNASFPLDECAYQELIEYAAKSECGSANSFECYLVKKFPFQRNHYNTTRGEVERDASEREWGVEEHVF